ncbi:MAG: hypothetical protein QOI86_5439 [Actinomycetota bacterium]|nr:hypothetical protein [Actinomycetota bacterium]
MVGIGNRKRRGRTGREEPLAFPSAEDAQRDAVIARLFDGVLRSARSQLLKTESPLAAEVWGSGLMAVWDGLPAGSGDHEPFPSGGTSDSAGAFAEALVRHAAELRTPEGMAVLAALASVAPARVATRARTAAAELEQSGIAAPGWAAVAGTSVPTEAWIGSDVYGDQEIVIVGFVYPTLPDTGSNGDGGHSICVLVDHTERGIAKDAYPAAPLAQTLARWREAEGDGIALRPASLPEVAARLADALLATDFVNDTPRTEGRTLAEIRALLAARLATLPPAAATGVEELDSDGRDWLVAEFLGAPEAADLLSEPAAVTVCHSLIAYRCDYGDGDALRWSPTLVGLCLLDHFPVKVSLDGPDLALVPDVLAAWVAFSARRRHLPEPALARILDVIDSCRADFPVVMGDVARYSPAKRAAMDMLNRGIDLTEDHAWAEAVGRN